MSLIEFIVLIFVFSFIFATSLISILSLIDENLLEEELFSTFVYAGLWKSKADYIRYFKDTGMMYYSISNYSINVPVEYSENFFDQTELRIKPFKWINGGTFGIFTIEPISFEVNSK
ncbi:hypothetical protein JYK00_07825 [Thermosipho ferrireducens]|uniref:Uncharacterized protein n=1 Tax=Thermosipho ferrireducens TaxID=2571116 RepID=A0ABX7S546_9BACT|nr:hypothetical protein [Thermosipho ferrireducens]QTA37631.1 hypothetical protein JYK00_07825 [Thermosipho ferrireducens]